MVCDRCGIEMRITASVTRPERDEQGGLKVYHVNETRCVNKRCTACGKTRENRVLLWQGNMNGLSAQEVDRRGEVEDGGELPGQISLFDVAKE